MCHRLSAGFNSVIASAARQSIVDEAQVMDCRAALAMTGMNGHAALVMTLQTKSLRIDFSPAAQHFVSESLSSLLQMRKIRIYN
ncbi:MAG: hypothetical protein ACWA6Y_04460 [Polaromonas sp.]